MKRRDLLAAKVGAKLRIGQIAEAHHQRFAPPQAPQEMMNNASTTTNPGSSPPAQPSASDKPAGYGGDDGQVKV